MGKRCQTLFFGGSKITTDDDCIYEIKRHFLLGRKVMTNLDSILKSRDIPLLTKVCLVKAMVFPVVIYGCESWTIKKAECQRIDALKKAVVLEKTLESPLNCKEIQPVNPKGSQSWIFIGKTDAETEAPILWPPDAKKWLIWKDPDAGKDWRQEEKGTTEVEMVVWHHRLDGHKWLNWTDFFIRTSGRLLLIFNCLVEFTQRSHWPQIFLSWESFHYWL